MAYLKAELHPWFLTLVAGLHRQGASLRAIGRELGTPASTIKREIDAYAVDGVYQPYRAQRAWAKNCLRPKQSKLDQTIRCCEDPENPPNWARGIRIPRRAQRQGRRGGSVDRGSTFLLSR